MSVEGLPVSTRVFGRERLGPPEIDTKHTRLKISLPTNQPSLADAPFDSRAPFWEQLRRELWFAGCLVKRFQQPAACEEMILTAFAEEGWPPRIDDPLPPDPNIPAKDRLRRVIDNLNRNQRTKLLRFRGDGTGCGILWEAVRD